MSRLSIFLTCLLLVAGGCKDTGTSITTPAEPTEFRQALIPLAVGNQWTYVDSLFTGSTVSVDTYTVLVSSFRFESGKVWWQLQERRPSSTINLVEIAARNDSIFSLQYNFQFPVSSLDYIPPPATDTLRFYSLLGGDVVLQKSVWLNGVYAVPAGSFDSCAVFFSLATPGGFVEVLKAKIGIVQKEIHYERSWRKVSLIHYELKR
jgi:hypothetical protein